ncbi:MFS transporter [Moheibacter sediminis]|uniref:Predicted arabinose efflux permease, MFS family n=1 Tax=Moheibacter sediminis TaxID=1434700 RepID=A0A1W2BIE5_9FLAO|nr:MFS transporter [Moheibacter sediminis]SMC72218.1 Predicted arabinose efflux permease, MFS family [Moheibacter sediminis]
MDTKQKQRVALSSFFLLSGICFSSWASRIPTLKDQYQLSDDVLGSLLITMPASALIGIPLSGWLISKYDSRIPLRYASFLFIASLLAIGFTNSLWTVIAALVVFSIALRVINISINTQSISLQEKFTKKIVGSFHAIWSMGGILGVLISTLMLHFEISMEWHFVTIALLGIIIIFSAYPHLIQKDKAASGGGFKLGKPSRYIMLLGLLVFFAAVCEGGMYDWNGVYFKEVVKAELYTFGYLLFMICMTISRLSIDKLIEHFSIQTLYMASSICVMLGISIAILFPVFWVALIGFCLVGFGISSLFPMTYMLTSKAKKYSVGIVISIVSTYSTVGLFIGPPIIGYLSELFGLQNAFITFLIAGFMFIPLSMLTFKEIKKMENT